MARDYHRHVDRSGSKMLYFPTQLTGKTWGVYNTDTNKCVATGRKHEMCATAKLLNDEHENERHLAAAAEVSKDEGKATAQGAA